MTCPYGKRSRLLMRETIYTIPVTEAFDRDGECPICELRKRFEKERVDYYMGAALMEPEIRIEMNKTGFCSRHFGMMYDTKTSRLGLGLVIDTYLREQTAKLVKMSGPAASSLSEDIKPKKSLFGSSAKKDAAKAADDLSSYIDDQSEKCLICEKLDYTMERYYEVFFDLYAGEKDFREKVHAGKGFCLPDFSILLKRSAKYLSSGMRAEFVKRITEIELASLDRLEKEVDWFTKKFDYRNTDAPWGNSKDAPARSIKKITGSIDIE